MRKSILTSIIGFIILFGLYHTAEYMIVFRNSAAGFLAFQFIFFIAAWLIGRWQFKTGLTAWGLNVKKCLWKHLILGMVMGVLLYGVTFMASQWLGIERVKEVPTFAAMASPLGLFIFGNFFSSLSEDVLTRGYVYKHLQGIMSNGWIVILSATVYLLNHIYRLGDSIDTNIYLFLLGVLFVLPLIRTKRLWFTGGMHWAGNVTFYFTHEVLKVEEVNKGFSPNYILSLVILLLIPVNYYLLRKFRMISIGNKA